MKNAILLVLVTLCSSASFAGNPQAPKPKAGTQSNVHMTQQSQNYHQQNASMGQDCYRIALGAGGNKSCVPAGRALSCAQKGLLNQIQCGQKLKAH